VGMMGPGGACDEAEEERLSVGWRTFDCNCDS
jgi:hypothetical protein